MNPIETPLGAVVRFGPAPSHLGKGLMLVIKMADPADPRQAEVYLDWDNVTELVDGAIHLTSRREQIDAETW